MSALDPYLPAGWILRAPYAQRIDQAVDHLREQGFTGAGLAVVLGSGLGDFVDRMDVVAAEEFARIPGFHGATVIGHSGRVVQARHEGVDVLVLQGRLHAYEGIEMGSVILPGLVLRALGADRVVLTNAAGGLHPGMVAGDLAVLTSVLDLHQIDVLRGLLDLEADVPYEFAARAMKPGHGFDPTLARRIRDLAPFPVHTGTYASLWGPNYETPLEIGMLRRLGAIAVGMSTGPEVQALCAFGAKVAGISMITNVAVEFGGAVVTHDEVVTVGTARRDAMQDLLTAVITGLGGAA